MRSLNSPNLQRGPLLLVRCSTILGSDEGRLQAWFSHFGRSDISGFRFGSKALANYVLRCRNEVRRDLSITSNDHFAMILSATSMRLADRPHGTGMVPSRLARGKAPHASRCGIQALLPGAAEHICHNPQLTGALPRFLGFSGANAIPGGWGIFGLWPFILCKGMHTAPSPSVVTQGS